MRILVATNMYPTPEMPAFGTFVYDQVAALRRAGVEVDVLYINGRQSRWNYLRGFVRYWQQIRRERYDLVHAHYVLTGVIARAQWGKRIVLTHHGVEALGYPRWQALLCKVVTPLFDAAIHVSEEVRRTLRDADGWVIPCGVDLDAFMPLPRDEARAQLGLSPDKRLILWAGEPWRPEKQFHLVEQALPLVQRELPDAELVVLSKKPHDEVPAYMSACDALILTSKYEGSPMVVKEAMACNLPVVSVPVGDVPEVIGDVPGCMLTTPEPSDIAAKLIAVLREPRRTDGRARIEHLRHDRVATRVLGVYSSAIGPKRG